MNKKYAKLSFFNTMRRITPIQFKSAPILTSVVIFIGAIHALMWTASIIATQVLFDTIAKAATVGLSFIDCLIPLLILSSIIIGLQIIGGLDDFLFTVTAAKSAGRIRSLLHKKLQRINPLLFEDTAFLDDINKAKYLVEGLFHVVTFVSLQFYSFILCFSIFYFGSVGAYLFSLKPMLLITLLIAFVPAMLSQIVKAKVFSGLEHESAPLRRENDYYQRTLCDREYLKETRVLGAFRFFNNLFTDTMTLLVGKRWKAERKTAFLQISLNFTSFIGMAISAYLLFTATITGEISIGAFAAVFAALNRLFAVMQAVIERDIGGISQDIGKVANFIRVMDMPEQAGNHGTADFSKGIVAKNISFTYPGRDKAAVNDVSLNITI